MVVRSKFVCSCQKWQQYKIHINSNWHKMRIFYVRALINIQRRLVYRTGDSLCQNAFLVDTSFCFVKLIVKNYFFQKHPGTGFLETFLLTSLLHVLYIDRNIDNFSHTGNTPDQLCLDPPDNTSNNLVVGH